MKIKFVDIDGEPSITLVDPWKGVPESWAGVTMGSAVDKAYKANIDAISAALEALGQHDRIGLLARIILNLTKKDRDDIYAFLYFGGLCRRLFGSTSLKNRSPGSGGCRRPQLSTKHRPKWHGERLTALRHGLSVGKR